MSEPTRIFYVCTDCCENHPEGSGYQQPNELRVLEDGRWLCEDCYDNEMPSDAPRWHTLKAPPEYGPMISTSTAIREETK